MNDYMLYVSDVSYYSGKLEAYLRYKQIPHRRVEVSVRTLREHILPATGVMKVPVMQCPDGRWLKDTTPMIAWLDARHPQHAVYPADAASRFIALLLEDYADEWLWRPAMYYRWRFADSHRLLRHRLGRELSRGTSYPAPLLGWYMRWRQYLVFVRGDGVRAHNAAQVQQVYLRTLEQLSGLLQNRRFLLGARPGIVDFAFFASMFRHFALDPHPARIMLERAPVVYAWVARLWNARGSTIAETPFEDFSSIAWDGLFDSIAAEYLPYLDCNADAWSQGRRRFDLRLSETRYPRMPTVRYRVACRSQLLTAYHALAPQARAKVQMRLGASGIARWLASAQPVAAGLDDEFVLPLTHRYPAARGLYGLRMFGGTPWDLPAAPLDDSDLTRKDGRA